MTYELPPGELIKQVTSALGELQAQLAGLPDEVFAKPSSLPGWSTAQLVAHLHSLAQAAHRQFVHAGQAQLPQMYDGGTTGRTEAINMVALLRPEKLRELVATSLDELRAVLPEARERWDEPVGYRPGAKVVDMMYAIWREMLIHATDLDAQLRPAASWPQEFSEHLLRALGARVRPTARIVLQPLGKKPLVLGDGPHSWVLEGTDFDLAAWLAGRPAGGVVRATAAADGAEFPTLLPWPSDRLLPR